MLAHHADSCTTLPDQVHCHQFAAPEAFFCYRQGSDKITNLRQAVLANPCTLRLSAAKKNRTKDSMCPITISGHSRRSLVPNEQEAGTPRLRNQSAVMGPSRSSQLPLSACLSLLVKSRCCPPRGRRSASCKDWLGPSSLPIASACLLLRACITLCVTPDQASTLVSCMFRLCVV